MTDQGDQAVPAQAAPTQATNEEQVVEAIDANEREHVARATRDAAARRTADQFTSELLGAVSHELRSPLASIKGYAATLLKHERRLPAVERHEFLQAIVEASDRLEVIIDRMLELSQVESGTLPLLRASVDLAHLAREALLAAARGTVERDMAERPLGHHDFSLALIPPVRGADRYVVSGDRRRLRRVLDQLLENAVKYSPRGGSITVALRPALLARQGAQAPHEQRKQNAPHEQNERQAMLPAAVEGVELEVRDAGIGIPDEHLERIFDRFHRVDTRLTREVDGLGLGLAIARRVVELHGGTIWAESTADMGSTFHMVLPLANVSDIGEDEAGTSLAGRGGRGRSPRRE